MTVFVNMDYKGNPAPIKCTYGSDFINEERITCPNDAMVPLQPDKNDPRTRYEGPLWCTGCQELHAQLRKHMLMEVLNKEIREIILKKRVLRRWRKHTLKMCFAARVFQAPDTASGEARSEQDLTTNIVANDSDLKGTSRDTRCSCGGWDIFLNFSSSCALLQATGSKHISYQRLELTFVADLANVTKKSVRWQDPPVAASPTTSFFPVQRVGQCSCQTSQTVSILRYQESYYKQASSKSIKMSDYIPSAVKYTILRSNTLHNRWLL